MVRKTFPYVVRSGVAGFTAKVTLRFKRRLRSLGATPARNSRRSLLPVCWVLNLIARDPCLCFAMLEVIVIVPNPCSAVRSHFLDLRRRFLALRLELLGNGYELGRLRLGVFGRWVFLGISIIGAVYFLGERRGGLFSEDKS